MTKKVTRPTTPEYYIGLDVHKSTISIAYAAADGSAPVLYGKTTGSNLAVERALTKLRKKLGAEKGDLRICYEAGPTGFVLARRLLQLGYARALKTSGVPDPRGQSPLLACADAPLLPPPEALRPQAATQQSHHRPRP